MSNTGIPQIYTHFCFLLHCDKLFHFCVQGLPFAHGRPHRRVLCLIYRAAANLTLPQTMCGLSRMLVAAYSVLVTTRLYVVLKHEALILLCMPYQHILPQVRMWETVHHDCIRVLTGVPRVCCVGWFHWCCIIDVQATLGTSMPFSRLVVAFTAPETTKQLEFGSSSRLRNVCTDSWFIHVHEKCEVLKYVYIYTCKINHLE